MHRDRQRRGAFDSTSYLALCRPTPTGLPGNHVKRTIKLTVTNIGNKFELCVTRVWNTLECNDAARVSPKFKAKFYSKTVEYAHP